VLESGAPAPYAFTGREWEPESGLYYYRARYYDLKLGRFMSEDPLGQAADVNVYRYALDNPARFRASAWQAPAGDSASRRVNQK
jgi:RHS repeat-associated protein